MKALNELVKYGEFLHFHGLVIGAGGNISSRKGNVVYIKKSGVNMSKSNISDYAAISLESLENNSGTEKRELSSETPMHVAAYGSRQDILAVAHTHSPYAITAAEKFSTLESPSYEFDCIVGKSVPVLPYIQPGSSELAEAVASSLVSKANGVIMKHHGVVAVGKNIEEACLNALAIERAALIACHS